MRKYFLVFKISIQNQIVYLSNFISGFVFYALIIFIFVSLWKVIYLKRGLIGGYDYRQVIWYCIITEMIMLSVGSGVFGEISSDIKSGNISSFLNKPYNYIFYNFSNSMGQTLLKLCLNAAIGVLMGMIFVGSLERFRFSNLPFMLASLFCSIFLNFFMLSVIGLTAFWFEDNSAFFWILQKILFMGGMFFPVDMLPEWLKNIALVLPFSYVTYAPARLLVKFSMQEFTGIISVQLIYITVFAAGTLLIYQKGVKALNVNGG